MYVHHMVTLYAPYPVHASPQAIMEVCLCHHTRRAARAISRLFDEALTPIALKVSQFNILAAIGAHDSASTADISRLLALDRTTLSRNLKPLRKAGYVSSGGGAGRRPDTLVLTYAGRTILSEATPLWQQAQGQLTQLLGTSLSVAVLKTLENVARILT